MVDGNHYVLCFLAGSRQQPSRGDLPRPAALRSRHRKNVIELQQRCTEHRRRHASWLVIGRLELAHMQRQFHCYLLLSLLNMEKRERQRWGVFFMFRKAYYKRSTTGNWRYRGSPHSLQLLFSTDSVIITLDN